MLQSTLNTSWLTDTVSKERNMADCHTDRCGHTDRINNDRQLTPEKVKRVSVAARVRGHRVRTTADGQWMGARAMSPATMVYEMSVFKIWLYVAGLALPALVTTEALIVRPRDTTFTRTMRLRAVERRNGQHMAERENECGGCLRMRALPHQ